MGLKKVVDHGRIKYVDENDKSYKLFLEYDLDNDKYRCCIQRDNLLVDFRNDKPFEENELYDKYFLPAKAAIEARITQEKEKETCNRLTAQL